MIQSLELDSGTKIILDNVEGTDIAAVGFWQLTGSRDEEATQSGYTHFLEHMLFKGTSRRSAYQIAREIERAGGYLNAFTEKEVTCFYCILPAEALVLAVDVLADMYFGARLDEEELEKEKSVVVNEIRTIEDNPEEKGQQLYLQNLWNGHPLSRKITGDVGQVQAIARDPLHRFYRSRFVPGNTVVTASGKLAVDTLVEALQERFSHSGPANSSVPRRQAPEADVAWQAATDKFEQVHLYTGVSFPSSHDIREYYRDLVFNTLFGESMSSRLFQRLREDRGLCYSVSSFRTYFTDVALWTIYASTIPSLLPPLMEAVDEQLGRLRTEPPSEREVAEAKSQLAGNMVLAREDMENRMKRLFRQDRLTGSAVEYSESMRLLSEVTRREVLALVEQRVQAERFSLLAYGSPEVERLPFTGYRFG